MYHVLNMYQHSPPKWPSLVFFLPPCASCRCPACEWDALAPGLYKPLSGNFKNRLVLRLWSRIFQLATLENYSIIICSICEHLWDIKEQCTPQDIATNLCPAPRLCRKDCCRPSNRRHQRGWTRWPWHGSEAKQTLAPLRQALCKRRIMTYRLVYIMISMCIISVYHIFLHQSI